MLSLAPTTVFAGTWDHRPHVSSPLSSSPIRATSPLSPVDNNARSQRQVQSSPIRQPKFKYASRPARQNPLLRKREDLQESRRRNFYHNVRQKAEDKAWQRRDIEGQFLKNSLLADMGRLSHDAPVLSESDLEDAMTVFEQRHREDDDMLHEFPQEEDDDDGIEAMIASFEEQKSPSHGGDEQRPSSPVLSDEDYDDIFAELIAQENHQLSRLQPSAEHMDMS
ncbi:hypothetical protein E4U42_000129 [Claviceps africana]|uniref:Uncharacterized protein n=1 Tax=Claviceps africana TaxID=83212 RepID=A0A8K0NKM0_9HYPO|nr:hypothetical protein E4U42_000129 [Claviceps africana]